MREAYSICKDDDGFIWASAKTGVMRISESDFRMYLLPHETTDFYFTRLIYTNSQLFAFSSNGQIFIYDKLHDSFNPYINTRKLSNEPFFSVRWITIEDNDDIWIASIAGLFRYNKGIFEPIFEEHINVQYLASYNNQCLFIATDNEIGLINKQTLEIETIYKYKPNDDILVSSYLYDEEENKFWIGTISSGLLSYDLEEKQLSKVLPRKIPYQPILAIKKNTKSNLFIGIDGKGLWEIEKEGKAVLNTYKEDANDPFSLHGDGVYDVYCDIDERVWVATFTGGLSYFDKEPAEITQITHQVNNSNSLVNNNVNKVIEDKRGNMWFATNNGISHWIVSKNQWRTYYDNRDDANVFLTLCEDNHGNIWAGSYASGVYVLDGNTGKEINHLLLEEEGVFSGRFITDIFKDSQGNMWFGGPYHIVCYVEKEKCFRYYDAQPLSSFEELSSDKILLACNYALILMDKNSGTSEILLDNYFVQDVIVLDNNLWLGTNSDGLIQYNLGTKKINKYTVESGLPSNCVNSIIHVNGHLWLGTENGLCQFDIRNELPYTYTRYPFSSLSFNVNTCSQLKNGDLMWGTNKGTVSFDPDLLFQTDIQGKIFFQDINISGRSIKGNEKLLRDTPVNEQTGFTLNYTQNNFMLEILPIGIYTTDVKFSWKLEGFDSEWSKPSKLKFINYTSLPSGNYKLKIKMYNSSISQVIDQRSLIIHITPPFWATWWFRLIILIAIAAIFLYLLKSYSDHLQKKYTQDKIRFFTNMAHDIRTSLTLISAPIEQLHKASELTEKSQYYLNLATEQSDRLSSVATQLLDFEKVDVGKGQLFLIMTDIVSLVSKRILLFEGMAKKKEVELVFSTSQESYVTALDELKIEKVIDNLISNAIKYSHPKSKVEIILSCKETEWKLEVKDYGLGISENAQSKLFREFYRGDNVVNSKMVGSGIGLLLVKNYVSMHKGNISLNSKENEGSSFQITIPYKEVDSSVSSSNTSDTNRTKTAIYSDINPIDDLAEKDNVQKKRMQLLIVEDNTDLQDFLKHALEEEYAILKADNGAEAWDIIQKEKPDMIISDVMMPVMDGFELCEKIKSTFETSHIPIILLTALSEKTKQLEGLGLGADDYITKPFDVAILKQRIKTIIKNREIIREKAFKLTNNKFDEQPILSNELNDKFVKKAIEVVNENISNCEFNKDDFASAMNISPSLLYQKIKNLTGQSPTDFIRTIRFNKALELLKLQKYTVTEVSELCGFSSANYFSTTFKKHFGKAPTEM